MQAVLAVYDPGFCWGGLGAALLAQGPVAYMADVRPVSTMRVENLILYRHHSHFLGTWMEKVLYFPGEWCRKLRTHRSCYIGASDHA
jgi:hypothetical protein